MTDAHSDPNGGDRRQEAEQLYVEFLGSDEASLTDGFERLAQRHPSLEDQLRSLHAQFENLERVLDEAAASPDFPFEEISRLHARGGHKRYRIEGEIARGGQGAVMRIWDSDLKRHLAMKLTLGRVTSGSSADGKSPASGSSTPPLDSRTIHRFLNEAKITGQLDHPGIVPIHELGVDDEGQAYFTMKLVNGHSLHEIFHRHRQGDLEWTTQRCVGLILKATEAVAYAHSKGIIHRDLKPANIMVGEYGEVYVMDWGMARSRVRAGTGVEGTGQASTALGLGGLETQQGAVFGTPFYMPPEQARGQIEVLDERSDVYSLGAVLYELLAGSAPYQSEAAGLPPEEVVARVIEQAPAPLAHGDPGLDPELCSIASKAMSRAPASRYSDAVDLLNDLDSYATGRVVRAHKTGLGIELRKWVGRNRGLAAALLAFVVATVLGLTSAAVLENRRAAGAIRSAREATLRADFRLSRDLITKVRDPWPSLPQYSEDWEGWFTDLERLRSEYQPMSGVGAEDATLARPADYRLKADERARLRGVVAEWDAHLDSIRRFLESGRADDEAKSVFTWRTQYARQERAKALWELDGEVPRPVPSQLDEGSAALFAGIVHNLDLLANEEWAGEASMHERRTALRRVLSGEHASRGAPWQQARVDIGDVRGAPHYGGFEIPVVEGLVPLGASPITGLWEFWLPASGELPRTDPRGRFEVTAESGIILILVPGGPCRIGVSGSDSGDPRFDPGAAAQDDPPVLLGELKPFLISKYELTQSQWWRLVREQPSEYFAGVKVRRSRRTTPAHPVETVSWRQASSSLGLWGLDLPTEAQWEHAARAGWDDVYAKGPDSFFVALQENWKGQTLLVPTQQLVSPFILFGNHYRYHAPVGSFTPNRFGLYDVLGNVSEWCRDKFATEHDNPAQVTVAPGSLELLTAFETARSYRGGSFNSALSGLRVGGRYRLADSAAMGTLGIRPVMNLPE